MEVKPALWLAALAAAVPPPGPLALAGKHVVTTVQAQRPQLLVDGRVAWKAASVRVPPTAAADWFYNISVEQRLSSVRASGSTVAFVHAATVVFHAKCLDVVPRCAVPIWGEPLRGELWQGRPQGSYRRVDLRGRAVATDVSGTDVLVATQAPTAVLLLRPHRRRLVLVTSRQSQVNAVALAGDYAAWTERRESGFVLKVYDIRANHIAYRLSSRILAANNLVPFDLAADGTVAFVSDRSPRGGCDGGVGWASPSEPEAHFLAVNALRQEVRLAAGQFAFVTRASCTSTRLRYELADRAGHVRSVAPAAPAFFPSFDFDGSRLIYIDENGVVQILRTP